MNKPSREKTEPIARDTENTASEINEVDVV